MQGVDESGTTYEYSLCKKSDPRGMVVLGDSASAHFHIPKQFITPEEFEWVNILLNAPPPPSIVMCVIICLYCGHVH